MFNTYLALNTNKELITIVNRLGEIFNKTPEGLWKFDPESAVTKRSEHKYKPPILKPAEIEQKMPGIVFALDKKKKLYNPITGEFIDNPVHYAAQNFFNLSSVLTNI